MELLSLMKKWLGCLAMAIPIFISASVQGLVASLVVSLLIGLGGKFFGAEFRSLAFTSFKIAFLIAETLAVLAALCVAALTSPGPDTPSKENPLPTPDTESGPVLQQQTERDHQ